MAVPIENLDSAAVARALSQLAESDDDIVDAYFERSEEACLPPEGETPGYRVRREEGLALRLVREERSWLASRDAIDSRAFAGALRQVTRVLPAAPYPEPPLKSLPWPDPPAADELAEFSIRVARAIRERRVAFPLGLSLSRHYREVQVVGPRLVSEPQRETFYSCTASLPWGRWGTLLPTLDPAGEARVAEALVGWFRSRQSSSPEPFTGVVVLAPTAAAVLLHEAVAHALEADTLAIGGRPEKAIGLAIGSDGLNVLDDPGSAPESVRRTVDDEGVAVTRRWLLRAGVVEQPLADRYWAQASGDLLPGGGRRSSRHLEPGPRSTHLELLPGDADEDDLLHGADGGLYIAEVSRGRLDPLSGQLMIEAPYARRIRSGVLADPVGPCRLHGVIADILDRVTAIGARSVAAGAGWCAKDGQKLPVWATTPAIRVEGVEIR